jgi:hypothetical protein
VASRLGNRLSNGQMLLEHAKVIQKSVYEDQHVIHEGHLRIIFTPELKVHCLVWGCACHR